jgi:hypothetical protein
MFEDIIVPLKVIWFPEEVLCLRPKEMLSVCLKGLR